MKFLCFRSVLAFSVAFSCFLAFSVFFCFAQCLIFLDMFCVFLQKRRERQAWIETAKPTGAHSAKSAMQFLCFIGVVAFSFLFLCFVAFSCFFWVLSVFLCFPLLSVLFFYLSRYVFFSLFYFSSPVVTLFSAIGWLHDPTRCPSV